MLARNQSVLSDKILGATSNRSMLCKFPGEAHKAGRVKSYPHSLRLYKDGEFTLPFSFRPLRPPVLTIVS